MYLIVLYVNELSFIILKIWLRDSPDHKTEMAMKIVVVRGSSAERRAGSIPVRGT